MFSFFRQASRGFSVAPRAFSSQSTPFVSPFDRSTPKQPTAEQVTRLAEQQTATEIVDTVLEILKPYYSAITEVQIDQTRSFCVHRDMGKKIDFEETTLSKKEWHEVSQVISYQLSGTLMAPELCRNLLKAAHEQRFATSSEDTATTQDTKTFGPNSSK